MNRTISTETMLDLLCKKPALIKQVKSISAEVFVKALSRKYKIGDYMTPEQKQELLTEKTLRAYLKGLPKDTVYYTSRIISYFPESVKAKVGRSIKRADIVKDFPTAPYIVWLRHVNKYYCDYDQIPENYRDREMRLAWLIKNNCREESAITDDLVDDLLRLNPSAINDLLGSVCLTRNRLALALNTTTESLNLNRKFSEIPHLWDAELVEKAILNKEELYSIPSEFLTKDLCLIAVKNDGNNLRWVPKKFLDMNMVCEGLGCKGLGTTNNYDLIPNSFMNKKFLLKIAAADYLDGNLRRLKAYLSRSELGNTGNKKEYQPQYFSRKWWPEVIKKCPIAIRLILKSDQTNEIIKAFITSALIELIDANVEHINLSKIKKPEYMAFLVGTTSPILQSIMSQILVSKEDNTEVVTPENNTCVIDLSNSEYRDIL